MTRRSIATFAALIVALVLGPVPSARAATFIVTKTADTADGNCNADCSLREAIIAANAAAESDSITVPPGTYVRTINGTEEDLSADGDLDIADDVQIRGPGPSARSSRVTARRRASESSMSCLALC